MTLPGPINGDNLARNLQGLPTDLKEAFASLANLHNLHALSASVLDRSSLVDQMHAVMDKLTGEANRNQNIDRQLVDLALGSASRGEGSIQFEHPAVARYQAVGGGELHVLVLKDGTSRDAQVDVLNSFSRRLSDERSGMTISSVKFLSPAEGIDPAHSSPGALLLRICPPNSDPFEAASLPNRKA